MVDAHFVAAIEEAEHSNVLVGLRQSLKQVLHENRLLEQEIKAVKELSVTVAQWLVQGSATEIRPICRQAQPGVEDAAAAPETPARTEVQPRSKRGRHK